MMLINLTHNYIAYVLCKKQKEHNMPNNTQSAKGVLHQTKSCSLRRTSDSRASRTPDTTSVGNQVFTLCQF